MLDRDLAMLYGIKTKHLNEQVKRNINRFEGFFFQLTDSEKLEVVANCDHLFSLKFTPNNPHAFNEYGILMLSSVLKSKVAIDINRKIIQAFVDLRKQSIEVSAYELLKQRVQILESVLEETRTHNLVTEATLSSKTTHLSRELLLLKEDVKNVHESLNTIQNASIIIKRPEEEFFQG